MSRQPIRSIPEIVAADPEAWARAREAARGGPKVLVATNVPAFSHITTLEGLLALALTLRGADVHFLQCDAVMPACLFAGQDNVPDPAIFAEYRLPEYLCKNCQAAGAAAYGPLGLPIHKYSSLVTIGEQRHAKKAAAVTPLEEIPHFRNLGDAIGEHAYAGALRYFARGDLEGVEGGEVVLRRYLEASLLAQYAVERLVRTIPFDASVFHHGIYTPQGIMGEVLRRHKIPLANWNPSYRKGTFIFSHGDSYHHTMLQEPVSAWGDIPWSEETEAGLMDYLKSRWYGTRDWIWFHEKPDEDIETFFAQSGIDRSKPVIGLLTNVIWDAQLHFQTNAFASMVEWVNKTIAYFAGRPDMQLLIRVHPAEKRGTVPSRQAVMDEIASAFPNLPPNVFIIAPESPVSTYAAMEQCDSVLIFGTKTGVELTSQSIPVIVGGEAWIRNKGLTRDASTPEEYFALLDTLPARERMSDEQTRMARKYAFHFFFRRMIPIPYIVPKQGKIYQLEIGGLADLAPGRSPGLDVICDGILKQTPFIYEAERLGTGED